MYKKIITGQFNDSFTPVMDGVTNVIKNYAFWLDKKYGESIVSTPAFPGYMDRENFPVLRYYSLPIKKRQPYRLGLEVIDINFRQAIKNIDFDIVHAHCPFTSGLIAHQLANKRNIPIIATFHSKYYDDFLQVLKLEAFAKMGIKIVIDFFNLADQVWTVSKGTGDTLRNYGYKGNIELIPNGTDFEKPDNIIELKREIREQLSIPPNQIVFLYVGQHIWQKNLKLIIESLKEFNKLNNNFKMIFIGEGYAKKELEELVEKYRLSNQVDFLGKIFDREKLKKYFILSDVLLFPSLYDNASIVIREAAAMSLPALVIESSNSSEGIINNINGYTSKNDIQNYTKSIIDITNNLSLTKEVGINASNTIYQSWENIVNEVYGRYIELINFQKATKSDRKIPETLPEHIIKKLKEKKKVN